MATKEESTTQTCTTIEQLLRAEGPVKYVPHGAPGSWNSFLAFAEDFYDIDDYDLEYAFRALVAYLLQAPSSPFVISQFHDSYMDDAPSYRIICYGLTVQQLMNFDTLAQPGWFQVRVAPDRDEGLWVLTILPTRSLMKLIYKLVI